tara:strand:+ start:720 stop:944 length:225 start_codon:yes stop_codon:yes gene_type:complete
MIISDSVVPEVSDIDSINVCSWPLDILEALMLEYDPERPENYEGEREVDMRVWALVNEMKMLLESDGVWFFEGY